jgi:hypothetical protein
MPDESILVGHDFLFAFSTRRISATSELLVIVFYPVFSGPNEYSLINRWFYSADHPWWGSASLEPWGIFENSAILI